jgi:hypothetical protein
VSAIYSVHRRKFRRPGTFWSTFLDLGQFLPVKDRARVKRFDEAGAAVGSDTSSHGRGAVETDKSAVLACALRRACPAPVSATSLGPFVDNTDADRRSAFYCGGEIDRQNETAIRFRSESASVAPAGCSYARGLAIFPGKLSQAAVVSGMAQYLCH